MEQFYPRRDHLPAGWVVFAGTKAAGQKPFPGQDASEQTIVTIAWPLLLPEDITWMTTKPDTREQRQKLLQQRIVRLVEHGWQHPDGPVLLTLADLALLLGLTTVEVSALLQDARQATGKPLITKGYFFDHVQPTIHQPALDVIYVTMNVSRRSSNAAPHSPRSLTYSNSRRVWLLLTSSSSLRTIPICDQRQRPSKLGLDKGAKWHYPSFSKKLGFYA